MKGITAVPDNIIESVIQAFDSGNGPALRRAISALEVIKDTQPYKLVKEEEKKEKES